jgi:hypothetical protein
MISLGVEMTNAFFHNGHHKSSIQTVYEKGLKDGQIRGIKDALIIIDEYQYATNGDIDDDIIIELRDKLRDLYASE